MTTAVELAVHFGAELVLVHVLAPPPMPPMVPPERMATLLSSVEVERYQRDAEHQARQNLERLVAENRRRSSSTGLWFWSVVLPRSSLGSRGTKPPASLSSPRTAAPAGAA